jgi:hypothetical protein
LQVALVPGELPQSAPPEGALPIIYADRVVGWSTPTVARVEDAEAVAAFRAMDVPLGWRVRAVLEPVPSPPAALVFGSSITSVGEAVSAPAALAAGVDANGLSSAWRERFGEVAAEIVYGESGQLLLPDGRLVEHGVLMVDGRRVESYRDRGALAKEIKEMNLHYGPPQIVNGAAGGEAELAGAIDRSAT